MCGSLLRRAGGRGPLVLAVASARAGLPGGGRGLQRLLGQGAAATCLASRADPGGAGSDCLSVDHARPGRRSAGRLPGAATAGLHRPLATGARGRATGATILTAGANALAHLRHVYLLLEQTLLAS